MARFEPRQATGIAIAAGESETATFDVFDYFATLDIHVKGTLAAGASVALSLQVSVNGTDWYDAKFVNLQGTDLDALVASVTVASTFAQSLMRLQAFAPHVRLVMNNGGGAGAATIDAYAVSVV